MVKFQFSDSNFNNISNSRKQAQTSRWTWNTLGFLFLGLSCHAGIREKEINEHSFLFIFIPLSVDSFVHHHVVRAASIARFINSLDLYPSQWCE